MLELSWGKDTFQNKEEGEVTPTFKVWKSRKGLLESAKNHNQTQRAKMNLLSENSLFCFVLTTLLGLTICPKGVRHEQDFRSYAGCPPASVNRPHHRHSVAILVIRSVFFRTINFYSTTWNRQDYQLIELCGKTENEQAKVDNVFLWLFN